MQETQFPAGELEPCARCAGISMAEIGNCKEPKATMHVSRIWDEAPVVPNREAKRNGSQEAKRYLTLEMLVWGENHTFRFSVNEIFGAKRFAPAVARLFLRLVFSRVIHED